MSKCSPIKEEKRLTGPGSFGFYLIIGEVVQISRAYELLLRISCFSVRLFEPSSSVSYNSSLEGEYLLGWKGDQALVEKVP